MTYDVSSPWRKSAIMPIWSIQLILLSVDLIIAAILIGITDNAPTQTINVGGSLITINSGTQKYVFFSFLLPNYCRTPSGVPDFPDRQQTNPHIQIPKGYARTDNAIVGI